MTGLDRSITATDESNGTSERLHGLIETDADIQPGDSGGSLIDADGQIIGIITAGSVSASLRGGSEHRRLRRARSTRPCRSRRTSWPATPRDTIHIGESAFLGVQVLRARAAPA